MRVTGLKERNRLSEPAPRVVDGTGSPLAQHPRPGLGLPVGDVRFLAPVTSGLAMTCCGPLNGMKVTVCQVRVKALGGLANSPLSP